MLQSGSDVFIVGGYYLGGVDSSYVQHYDLNNPGNNATIINTMIGKCPMLLYVIIVNCIYYILPGSGGGRKPGCAIHKSDVLGSVVLLCVGGYAGNTALQYMPVEKDPTTGNWMSWVQLTEVLPFALLGWVTNCFEVSLSN